MSPSYRRYFNKLASGCKAILIGAALASFLPACGRTPDTPKAPPRPTTFGGEFSHALMSLPERPAPVSPGEM